MTEEQESWLPNLVGEASIWKLARDLNEEQFFDGRLLVPDTEGSDSLPVRVTWDLTGLIPLPEAREQEPERVRRATEDFFVCLERTAAVFEKGGSGYDKYKKAFTVPALDADGGAHYFFDPKTDKLCVINWGASPRKIKHAKEYLFGYQDFGVLIEKAEASLGAGRRAAMVGGAAAAGTGAAAEAAAEGAGPPGEGEQKDEEKKVEEKKVEESTRPWWMWVLYAIGLAFLIWLAIMLLRECEVKRPGEGAADGAVGNLDGSLDGALDGGALADGAPADGALADGAIADGGDGGERAIYGHSADDAGPAATDMRTDGSVAARDAGPGGTADIEPGGEIRDPNGRVRVRPPRYRDGRYAYGQYRDPSGRYYYWIPGANGGDPVSLPHREHYHPEAMQWRIVGASDRVYDYTTAGQVFHVYLHPGQSFDGVHVQWRDAAGNWHDH